MTILPTPRPCCLHAAVHFYVLLSLVLDSAAPFSVMLLGLPLQPSFNKPYLASSLRDFWSRRWNLTIGCTLRDVLFEPLWEDSWVRPSPQAPGKKDDDHTLGSQEVAGTASAASGRGAVAVAAERSSTVGKQQGGWKKLVGSLLVFFVSGVMHEVWLR
jgi:hypothetical protein